MKTRYIIVDSFGDPVFNSSNQSHFFPSAAAAWREVELDLDEPESEDEDGVYTKRTDGGSKADYTLFREVVKR